MSDTSINVHNIVEIKVTNTKLAKSDTRWTSIVATDKDGNIVELTLFNDDMSKAIPISLEAEDR